MYTLVPFDARDPNSRLAPVLDPDERRALAAAMLRDVLDTVREAGGTPRVVSTVELVPPFDVDTPVIVDDRSLSTAIGARLDGDGDGEFANDGGTAVVMSDLAIATPAALRRAFVRPAAGEVAAAPGRGGGTNVLVVRHPDFRPDYHGTSFDDHRQIADEIGAPFRPVDSFRLAIDVDGPDDLPEVLLHGRGRAAEWLADEGFSVEVEAGDARVTRDPGPGVGEH